MELHLADPAWLLLLALGAPVAWTGLRWLSAMSMVRRVSAVVLRVLLIALIAGVLAGASTMRSADRLALIAVVDVSGSVRGADASGATMLDASRAVLDRIAAGRGPDDLLGIVAFDGRAIAIASPTTGRIEDRVWDFEPSDGSDLERAIRYASAMIPADAAGRLLLLSDGAETQGDAVRAASELASRGVRIDAVPLEVRAGSEVRVDRVDLPIRAAAGSMVTARVLLRSTGAARGELRLTLNGEPVEMDDAGGLSRVVSMGPGERVEQVSVRLPEGRVHTVEAIFEPEVDEGGVWVGDTFAANNRATGTVLSPGRGAVLLVDGVSGGDPGGAGATLVEPLRRASIDVRVVAPEGMPRDLLELEAFDLVVLLNVPASAVERDVQGALASYVRDLGGGLAMVGGPMSFGAGAWKGTPIEPILPVLLDLPERIVMPEAAIVFVIDSSGSMRRTVMGSTRSQQDVANEATVIAVRSLDKNDLVGVIEFNNVAEVVTPLGRNSDPDQTASQVMAIRPDGGTDVRPGLIEAANQLRRVEAKLKHIVVLSDGQSEGARSLPEMAAELAAQGIKVSAIAVGDGADAETMREMADRGMGVFYSVLNPTRLPRVFLKVIELVRSPLVRLERFSPVVMPSGSPLTLELGQPPDLLGLVLTRARPDPSVTLAMTAPGGEPLLAHWPVELGQVAAFTSDTHEWAAAWLGWEGFAPFWTRLVRTIGRAPMSGAMELRVSPRGNELLLAMDAFGADGKPIDLLTVDASVYERGSSAEPELVQLSQTGPGLYEGVARATPGRSYVVLVRPRQGERKLAPVLGAVSSPSGVEYRTIGTDVGLLGRIAERTGGRVLDIEGVEAGALYRRGDLQPRRVLVPLWKSLLPWILIVLMLDLATRRIAWDRFVSDRYGEGIRKVAADRVRSRGSEATTTLGALRGVLRQGEEGGAGERGAAVLTERDAIALRERQRAERLASMGRQAREKSTRGGQALDAGAGGEGDRPGAPGAGEGAATRGESGEQPGESGLMAAKRRARERIERERTGESGGPV